MAALRLGRNARIFVNQTMVTLTKDIGFVEADEEWKIKPRDLAFAAHFSGGKDCVLTFQKLEDDGADFTLLQTARDQNKRDLLVWLVYDVRRCTSPALRFIGTLLKFETQRPENGVATTEVVLANAGLTAEDGPTRFTWTNPDGVNCIP